MTRRDNDDRNSHVGFTGETFVTQQYRVPTIDLDQFQIEQSTIDLVGVDLCRRHRIIPVSSTATMVIIAMLDPENVALIELLKAHTGLSVEPVVTTEKALASAMAKHFREDK
mgnify:CR=1 FL=1